MPIPEFDLRAQAWIRCDRKIAYRSRRVAEEGARQMGKKNKRPYDVYTCLECGLLHVGRHPHPELLGPLCEICYTPIPEDRLKEKLKTCCGKCAKEKKYYAKKSATDKRPASDGQCDGSISLEGV